MTKKKSKNTQSTSPKTPSSRTASYSTRFSPEQRELIEHAASIKQWSPATLIRNAAIELAADIVNASGPAERPLQRLASKLAEFLLQPNLRVSFVSPMDDPIGDRVITRQWTWDPSVDKPLTNVECIEILGLLSEKEIAEFKCALGTCGLSLSRLLVDYLSGRATPEHDSYQPKLDPKQLLKD